MFFSSINSLFYLEVSIVSNADMLNEHNSVIRYLVENMTVKCIKSVLLVNLYSVVWLIWLPCIWFFPIFVCLVACLSLYLLVIIHYHSDLKILGIYWLIDILGSLYSHHCNADYSNQIHYWIYFTTIQLLDILFPVLFLYIYAW